MVVTSAAHKRRAMMSAMAVATDEFAATNDVVPYVLPLWVKRVL